MREASRTKIIKKEKLTEELIFSILRQHVDILRKLSVRKMVFLAHLQEVSRGDVAI